ncbi:hypothetical protein [Paenibacillus donghaensis]|nr:hypothetical protein [Paenibacillus donghaensis]
MINQELNYSMWKMFYGTDNTLAYDYEHTSIILTPDPKEKGKFIR